MHFLMVVSLVLLMCCANSYAKEVQKITKNRESIPRAVQADAIGHGLTHIYFDQWQRPKISVYIYIPWNVDPKKAPILFMMHGAKRNSARYLSEWDGIAEKGGFIVIAPEFDRKHFPKSLQYNQGNVFKKSSLKRNPEGQWSFSAIEKLFDYVVESIGGQQKQYTLYGHSAGSQFAHRYLMFKPKARVKNYLFANAGWYTFADLSIDYPYGLRGSGVSEATLKVALQKDIVVLLGDQDNDSGHTSLRRSKEANAQGAHRFERGQAFYLNAKANAEKYGVKFGWKIRIVRGVAHSNGGIALKSGDLVKGTSNN